MNLGLTHKVVLITGAAGAIGAAVARAFAAEGATVALLDINRSGLVCLATEIRAAGGTCSAATADLTQLAEAEQAVEQVLAPFGGRVDVLITTAGICPAQPLAEMLAPQALLRWRELYEQNVLSALLPIMLVLPRMKAQGAGVILTTASDLAAQPVPEMLPYSTAKAALVHLTHGLAAAVGQDHIRVVAIAPGPVRTAIWTRAGGLIDFYAQQHALPPNEALKEELRARGMALARLIEPEEIAHLLLYLASPWAAAITRCVMDINGGSHAGY
jgi:NAD(P)-dependent dehydrogenase (short-subunit alcohol dehydrogenase family)